VYGTVTAGPGLSQACPGKKQYITIAATVQVPLPDAGWLSCCRP